MALYANRWGPEGITYPDGRPAVGQSVEIVSIETSILATLYSDHLKSSTVENPTHCDSLGNLVFFADPGDYYCVVNAFRFDVTIVDHPDEPSGGSGGDGITVEQLERATRWHHVQSEPLADWQMDHPLGYKPAGVQVITDQVVQVGLSYPSDGRVIAHHDSPTTGEAYFS
jgi:hypothetical protein